MAITTADIHATADKIAAEGGSPTLVAVRSALGGGSFTTISEAMKEWKASKQASTAPMREPAPAAIAERMAEAASEAWAVALEMANDRMRSEREALDVARIEMESSKSEAAELADQLAADLEAAQATIEQQRETLKAAGVQAAKLAAENAALVQQLVQQTDTAHSAAAALSESRERIEQMSNMLSEEREERAAAQKLTSSAEQAAAVLTAKLESSQQAREQEQARAAHADKEARERIEQITDVLNRERTERAAAEQAAAVLIAKLEGAVRELETAHKSIAEARAEAKKAGEDAAELRGRLEAVGRVAPKK